MTAPMKPLDQCPSTKGELPASNQDRAAPVSHGRRYWRSVDEFADSQGFRDFVEREFPGGASELLSSSRRDFMKLMGASMALAGAATIPGCRRPDHKIMPYSAAVPEDVIPGKAMYYATAMPLPGGGAEGLIVETHENRPTKIEGNPLHAINRGRTSVFAQASILGLYDPDRLTDPRTTIGGQPQRPRSWEEFNQWQEAHFARFDATGGATLAFIVDKKTSPSRDRAKAQVLKRWPGATWIAYDPAGSDHPAEGTVLAFGQPMRVLHDFAKAKRILAISSDFLCSGAMSVPDARAFAAGRRVVKAHDQMNRLYAVETAYTNTGASADHRLALPPSEISAYVVRLAKRIVAALSGKAAADLGELAAALLALQPAASDRYDDQQWINAVAQDLIEHQGQCVIVAGPSVSPQTQALIHALNAVLGNVPATVTYLPMGEEEALSTPDQLKALADRIRAGQIDTIVTIDANPVFDAPAGLEFEELYTQVPTTVCMASSRSETSSLSTWALNGTHYLEAWGDAEAYDGSATVIQPMIAPLYQGKSEIELLAMLAGDPHPDGRAIVRDAWRGRLGDVGFDKKWNRWLQDGVIGGVTTAASTRSVRMSNVADAVKTIDVNAGPVPGSLDVLFMPGNVYDGRFANIGWLQELPQPATCIAWDNPALISPSTAERLGLMPEPYTKKMPKAKMIRLAVGGHAMEIPVWVMPGMPDDTVILQFGYGRRVCGRVGGDASPTLNYQVGFNTYQVKPAGVGLAASGAQISRVPGRYMIASTQNHWSLEGRTSIVRQIDKKWWDAHAEKLEQRPGGREVVKDSGYGTTKQLNVGEKLGEMAHAPPNLSIYDNPRNQSQGEPIESARYAQGQQWGMTIDLATCTGCGVCTIACQAENNIPIVGKKETAKGREMAWIRVDRYYYSGDGNTGSDWRHPDGMVYQPVACVHCENAPCETVCPVNATSHGPEGMNYMVYNRCIGTRYCANNCPYKVRRFNFFDYGVKKFNGDFIGQGITGRPDNVNFIPPRLREKLNEIEKLQKNPDVTVRSRGVM